MSTTNNRVVAGVAVAAISLTLAGTATALAGPDTSNARAGVLTKAEKKAVKKIAKKVAAQQVKRLAPTLDVNSAKTAGSAGTAGSAATATTAQTATHATTADMATNAQNAANAAKVGGLDVMKVDTVVPSGGAPVQVINSAPFTLTASCVGGAPELTAAATPAGGRFRVAVLDNTNSVSTDGISNLGSTGFDIIDGADGLGSLTAEYVSPAGKVVNIWVGYRDDAPGCAFFGNYMVG